MPLQNYKSANNAQGVPLAGITAGATSLILQTNQGGLFPSVFPFPVEIKEVDTALNNYRVLKREIAVCTGRSGDTLTITRATEPCPADYAATSQTQTAFSFSNPASTIVTCTWSAAVAKDITDAIAWKVDTAAGLRTTFGTDKHVRVNRGTGAEESKPVTTWSSMVSTDIFRVEQGSGWDYKDVPYSTILWDILSQTSAFSLRPAGENLILGDALTTEVLPQNFFLISSGGYVWNAQAISQFMGQATANTKVSSKIFGNGVSASNIKLALAKVWAPTDNFIVRVETDNAGNPSGTLAHANASWTIAGTSLTTGWVDTTINFTGAFTLTDGVVYHMVFSRQNAVDGSNYYQIWHFTQTTRGFLKKTYNGTTWADDTTQTRYMVFAWSYNECVVKTSATNDYKAYFEGFSVGAYNAWDLTYIQNNGICSIFSGLTVGAYYFLGNTAGTISTTPGTSIRQVGRAVSSTKIEILQKSVNYTNLALWGLQVRLLAVNPGNFTCRIEQSCTLRFNHNTGGTSWSISVTKNNTLAWNQSWGNNNVTADIAFNAWDTLSVAYSGGTFSLSIFDKVIPIWKNL